MQRQINGAGITRLDNTWAIMPDALKRIQAAAGQLMRGEFDTATLQAQLAQAGGRSGLTQMRDVAVIRLEGVLTRQLNFLSFLFGGTSTEQVERDFQAAMTSPEIGAVLLLFDSPGGTVDGSAQLADTIFAWRGKKPIVALADGMAASAAAWIAAAADKFFLRGPTAITGSIGITATHVDLSQHDQAAGVRYTEIASTPRKGLGSPQAPLTDEGRDQITQQVEFLHAEFVRTLARFRGVTISQAMGWATGDIFFAERAVEVGLADGLATPSHLIAKIAGPGKPQNSLQPAPLGIWPTWKRLQAMAGK